MPEAPADDAADLHKQLVPRPSAGRTFSATRRARFGDLSPGGRLRLDALARYFQDVSSDDTTDAGLSRDLAWVVRRMVVDVEVTPGFREGLTLTTWCSGTGRRWAERRVSVEGDGGARVEAAVLWVHVDMESGRPIPLAPDFWDLYAESAGGRTVRVRLRHDPSVPPDATPVPWTPRFADYDLLGHVNNAVYGAMVEEVLAVRPDLRPPFRVEIEYRDGIGRDADVGLLRADTRTGVRIWMVDRVRGDVYGTATIDRP